MSYRVRTMEERDEHAVREILHLADPAGLSHPSADLIWERWGRYYFENCRPHCFVAQREEDGRVLGVILCSPRTTASMREFNRDNYPGFQAELDRVESEDPEGFRKAGLSYYRVPEGRSLLKRHPLKGRLVHIRYPAHLHINVHPDAQRQGLGHLLVDRLISHLKSLGVPGLHLIVASDNVKGIGFYRRYGFKPVLPIRPEGEGGIVFGLDLCSHPE